MEVFADTSGLFAALVVNDCQHNEARRQFEVLLDSNRYNVQTTSFVLLETMALLQNRVGLDAALRFSETIRPLLQIYWLSEEHYLQSYKRLKARSRRKLSLVDCSSFVHMEAQGVRKVFGFDKHFREEGYTDCTDIT